MQAYKNATIDVGNFNWVIRANSKLKILFEI
jgi:hypothetical protein